MSYQQAMRHFGNHRKDRFNQQCSGLVREPGERRTPEQMRVVELCSLERIAETAGNYPIYIKPVSDGIYVTTSERDSFATKIANRDELNDFIRDFIV